VTLGRIQNYYPWWNPGLYFETKQMIFIDRKKKDGQKCILVLKNI